MGWLTWRKVNLTFSAITTWSTCHLFFTQIPLRLNETDMFMASQLWEAR